MTLDKLSLASRHYRLEALQGQFCTAEQVVDVLQIGWQERMTVHYRVIPLDEESKTCLLSECSFSETAESSTKECVASDSTDYLCLERACETFEVRCYGMVFVHLNSGFSRTFWNHTGSLRGRIINSSLPGQNMKRMVTKNILCPSHPFVGRIHLILIRIHQRPNRLLIYIRLPLANYAHRKQVLQKSM
jgi:hypothetical protein